MLVLVPGDGRLCRDVVQWVWIKPQSGCGQEHADLPNVGSATSSRPYLLRADDG